MKHLFWIASLLWGCGEKLDGDGDGFHELTGDCDDANPDIHPAAIEICDELDNDCNGLIDELGAQGGIIFYVDLDGDGHGSENGTLEACSLPLGYSTSKKDCDESDALIHPDADELCDGIDNDCDTHVDEYTAIDAMTWFPDRDGDGFGAIDDAILGCEAPPDYVSDGSDCDDIDPNVHPNATESCETEYDDNCDSETNEQNAFGCMDFFADLDGDGFGGTSLCLCEATSDYPYETGGDCNDNSATISPLAEEVVDLIDNNCDGTAAFPLSQADVLLSLPQSNLTTTQLEGGDFNGDGFADILTANAHTREVYLLYGPDISSGNMADSLDVIIRTETNNMMNHRLVALDVNHDGSDDIILTHRDNDGTTNYIFTSPFGAELTLDDATAEITTSHTQLESFYTKGDLNGDGFADLILSDPLASTAKIGLTGTSTKIGQSLVFLTPLEGTLTEDDADKKIIGEAPYDKLGRAVSTGDFDGDGIEDLVSTAHSTAYSSFGGSLRFFYNPMAQEVPTPDDIVASNAYFSYVGESLVKPTDVNGDGHLDYVLTTSRHHNFGAMVVIMYGPIEDGLSNIEQYPLSVYYDPFENERPSYCIELIKDMNGDNQDELLIGDQFNEDYDGGVVHLIDSIDEGYWNLESTGVKIHTNDSVNNVMGFCRRGSNTSEKTFLSPGDVNGDGIDDILIAGKQYDETSTLINHISLIWGTLP